jgi:hypothetical protein
VIFCGDSKNLKARIEDLVDFFFRGLIIPSKTREFHLFLIIQI